MGEGDRGYEDEHGAHWREHQLGSESKIILPRSIRGVYMATRYLNEVSSHLFHPFRLRVSPVLVC